MVPKLAPMNPPLGPQPDYRPGIYSAEQVTLAMKEKVFSLSGDDFTVKKADGETASKTTHIMNSCSCCPRYARLQM